MVMRSLEAGWNRERWERLGDDGNRYEVIDGVLYMTTAPVFFHQWIIRQIFLALYQHIDTQGVGITIWSPLTVFMPGCDPVQPDLVVVRTGRLHIIRQGYITGVPTLLIEVLASSNCDMDMVIKRAAYARAGVPEYWIVRPATRDVLVCIQPDAIIGDYVQEYYFGPGVELESPTLPLRTSIAEFFFDSPDTTL
jgi:Uma2 family endonuclease